jgi:exo-beta-1,3-glucanase (GH17 family)
VSSLEPGNAICYSGYRQGQSPRDGVFPSPEEIREDLLILARNWAYLRLYDPSVHAERVLEVIRDEGLDLRVMLGADLAAEVSNPDCPWGGEYDDKTLVANRSANEEQIGKLIALANAHPETVVAASIGNEASVEWTDHLVPVDRLVDYAREVRAGTEQPVTFCENYVPWTTKLAPLAEELDVLAVHTYPVWEYCPIDDALAYTKENYRAVADRYPDHPVVITEAGWTTASNGRGIEPENASEELQARYYEELLDWANREQILTFVFEAFDEPWKGSAHPLEPEKHWGLFRVDRTPKLVMASTYPDMVRG